jgi:hypothetical protein
MWRRPKRSGRPLVDPSTRHRLVRDAAQLIDSLTYPEAQLAIDLARRWGAGRGNPLAELGYGDARCRLARSVRIAILGDRDSTFALDFYSVAFDNSVGTSIDAVQGAPLFVALHHWIRGLVADSTDDAARAQASRRGFEELASIIAAVRDAPDLAEFAYALAPAWAGSGPDLLMAARLGRAPQLGCAA